MSHSLPLRVTVKFPEVSGTTRSAASAASADAAKMGRNVKAHDIMAAAAAALVLWVKGADCRVRRCGMSISRKRREVPGLMELVYLHVGSQCDVTSGSTAFL